MIDLNEIQSDHLYTLFIDGDQCDTVRLYTVDAFDEEGKELCYSFMIEREPEDSTSEIYGNCEGVGLMNYDYGNHWYLEEILV